MGVRSQGAVQGGKNVVFELIDHMESQNRLKKSDAIEKSRIQSAS